MDVQPIYNFYVETTKEELKTKQGFSTETFTEFSFKDIEKIKRKCYRYVYLEYMTKNIDDIFCVRAEDKMYLQEVIEESKYTCYGIYDIFSDVTEVAFRLYIKMKKKQVYNPYPKGYIACTSVFIDATVSNDINWPLLVLIKCLQLRNLNVFII